MKIFGLAGWSGSGKTTLMAKLLPELIGRGYAVSTMKHAHHAFDVDTPGKDSFIHRESGATEVMIGSAKRWALMHEVRDEPEPDFDTLLAAMTPVDLLLIEGFKQHGHAKLEISRAADQADGERPYLHLKDKDIVAIASDRPLDNANLPVLDLNDAKAIASFIITHTGLEESKAQDKSKETIGDGST